MEVQMNRTLYVKAGPFASTPLDSCSDDAAAERKAQRVVNTVATLRVLVPVALMTAIVISGRVAPEFRMDSAMAAIANTPAVTNAAAQSYFPAQYINQGAGGEEHIASF
jgi:hypothetical protein